MSLQEIRLRYHAICGTWQHSFSLKLFRKCRIQILPDIYCFRNNGNSILIKYFFFQMRATRFSRSTKVYFYLTEGIIYILVQSHKYIYVSRTGSFVLIQLSNTNTIKELKHDGIKGKKPHLKIYLPKYFYSVDSALKYILFTILYLIQK